MRERKQQSAQLGKGVKSKAPATIGAAGLRFSYMWAQIEDTELPLKMSKTILEYSSPLTLPLRLGDTVQQVLYVLQTILSMP